MISEVSDCQTNVNVDVDKTVLFDEIQFPIISSFSVRLAPPPPAPQTMTQWLFDAQNYNFLQLRDQIAKSKQSEDSVTGEYPAKELRFANKVL